MGGFFSALQFLTRIPVPRGAYRLEESVAIIRRDRDRSRDFLADVSHELRTPITALQAVLDSVESIRTPTPWGDWHSLAVVSRGEYGIPEGLQFGFPVRSDGLNWEVVTGLEHDDDAKERIRTTTDELVQERDLVKGLVPS